MQLNTVQRIGRCLDRRTHGQRRVCSIKHAARSLTVAETWYREGEGSFSDFVETEAIHYNFQLSAARAEADYGKFLARLERLAGRDLTERVQGSDPVAPQEGAR